MDDEVMRCARALAAEARDAGRPICTRLLMDGLAVDYVGAVAVLGLLRAEGLAPAPPSPRPVVRPRKLPVARLMPAARVLACETIRAGKRVTAELLARDLSITLHRAARVLDELAAEGRDRPPPPGRGYDPGGSATSARRLASARVTSRSGLSSSAGRHARGP